MSGLLLVHVRIKQQCGAFKIVFVTNASLILKKLPEFSTSGKSIKPSSV